MLRDRARALLVSASLVLAGLAVLGGADAARPATAADADPVVADPVVAAAGDIACDPTVASPDPTGANPAFCQHRATSDLLVGQPLAAVLALGDLQYEDGAAAKFAQAYHPTWGRVKSLTRPVPGNHEYGSQAVPYFDYFGEAAGPRGLGYYSYDVGRWHVIALNSNCSEVSCDVGSAQEQWLRADLARSTADCTLAYLHHPRFASGKTPRSTVRPLWQALQDAGADVLLAGHEHNYERFAPQDVDGRPLATGIRQFVVGTGGKNFYVPSAVAPNSEVRRADAYGVLLLTLKAQGYDWRFAGTRGEAVDAGTGTCTPSAGAGSPTPIASQSQNPIESPSPAPTASSSPAPACTTPPVLRLSPDPLRAGAAATVEVQGEPGRPLQLWAYSRPGTTYRLVREGSTDSGGAARFTVSPPTNTRLYAQHPGCGPGPSAVLDVAATLSLQVQRLGTRDYLFTGDSLPARAGGLIVSLYRRTGDGSEVLTAQARADAATGEWALGRRFTGTGRFDFLVRTGQDLQNAPGSSNARSLLVY